MAAMKFNLHVEMEDGATYDVVADQRDVGAWEIYSEGRDFSSHPHSAMRYLAWSALTRKRLISGNDSLWENFGGKCVEVSSTADEDATKS